MPSLLHWICKASADPLQKIARVEDPAPVQPQLAFWHGWRDPSSLSAWALYVHSSSQVCTGWLTQRLNSEH